MAKINKRTSLYIVHNDLWGKAKKEAGAQNRSLSNFIEFVLDFYFKYRNMVERKR